MVGNHLLSALGRGVRFGFGVALAAGLLGGLAETYLRLFPPRDLHPYLGEESPLTGIYKPDDDFNVGYRSWEDLCLDNGDRLGKYLPFQAQPESNRRWAFFGNSFVQAPGMLADFARKRVTNRCIVNLGRNETICVRMAQIKLLLEHDLRPERIFMALMHLDVADLGMQPLATRQVTSRGALTFRLPAESMVCWFAEQSRLGLTACVRTGKTRGNPRFHINNLNDGVPEPLRSDLQFLFGNLARICRQHQAPMTVILIPGYYQIMRGDACGFQDTMAKMLRDLGHDVLDPREAFMNQSDPETMFIPDKHFSDRGNDILLTELLKHLDNLATHREAQVAARVP